MVDQVMFYLGWGTTLHSVPISLTGFLVRESAPRSYWSVAGMRWSLPLLRPLWRASHCANYSEVPFRYRWLILYNGGIGVRWRFISRRLFGMPRSQETACIRPLVEHSRLME